MPPPSSKSSASISLSPTVVDGPQFSLIKILVKIVPEDEINQETFSDFDHSHPVGISPGYSPAGKLFALAICDESHCMIIEFQNGRANKASKSTPSQTISLLQQQILLRQTGHLFAFDMATLAMSLHIDMNLRITNAIDIQSAVSGANRKPLSAIKEILGTTGSIAIKERHINTVFANADYDPRAEEKNLRKRRVDLAQRAWISQVLPSEGNGAEIFDMVRSIDTEKLSPQVLDVIAKISNDTLRQDVKKPNRTVHQATITLNGIESPTVHSEIYKNKLRSNQTVKLVAQSGGGNFYTIPGQVGSVKGKSGSLVTKQPLGGKDVTNVISIGRDDPTTAEARRAEIVLRILQGDLELLSQNPWIQNIYFPHENIDDPLEWPLEWSNIPSPQSRLPSDPHDIFERLNSSQQNAVNTMLSTVDDHRITIIQGPPGTGKTSVIAAFVLAALASGYNGIWLVAQSNVAVKNIAEKLVDVGLEDWRLLVSVDFHFEWHEHIYCKVLRNIIQSDQFAKINAKEFEGCKVFLCTLSMLSNHHINKFTFWNPIKTVVVDEASQIECGDYLSLLGKHQDTLHKICFIGDDKQLPPFGQEDLQNLESIFEKSHLRQHVLFLDTQYRMPPQIGHIISDLVYDGKLQSNPDHPITSSTIACHFVDVPSHEERDKGASFMNALECSMVIKLAYHLQVQQKAYQIITPYDAQRNKIEGEMKQADGLHWENKCFNVDSFQGNEEDYIIISLVRTRELGFLNNRRRTNVMLTRCKKGMFIVTSQKFLSGRGGNTLVGEFAVKMGDKAWLEGEDLEEGRF